MIMCSNIAIAFSEVSKSYKLYQSKFQQMLDLLGISRAKNTTTFDALKDINFEVKKGQRLGIVGRNGAGKTTLLKLITQNFLPTKGNVYVNGRIQALMMTGLGFHPEFTGMENIKSSLLFNGLSDADYQRAIDDIVDFTELGDFLWQPFKTYSLGMQSRLFFAVATAVKPEILVVDEILGAGDAYFSTKSAERMKQLTNSGCTLILVSHSMSQILQFCEDAIWLENGQVVMQDESIEVVKCYEAYSRKLEKEYFSTHIAAQEKPVTQTDWLKKKLIKEVLGEKQIQAEQNKDKENHLSESRWPSQESGLQISKVVLEDKAGQVSNVFETGQFLKFVMEIEALESGEFDCIPVILIFDEEGRWITRHTGELTKLSMKQADKHVMSLTYEALQLGRGTYVFSAAIYKKLDLFDLSTARYYDLLARSFTFKVIAYPETDLSIIYHPATWHQEKNSSLTHSLQEENVDANLL